MRISSQKPRRKRRGFGVFLALTAMVTAVFIFTDMSLRPVVEEMVAYQAKVFATKMINAAMIEQLENEGSGYERFVRIMRDDSGGIEALEADMLQINRLKSNLGGNIARKLEERGSQTISVPIGTILGSQFTSGRGPLVDIRMIPGGYVQTEIHDKFTAAGINQTLHQIMLGVTVQMTAVFPGYNVRTETQTNFCIAETVIVGNIPQGYASIGETAAAFAPVGRQLEAGYNAHS